MNKFALIAGLAASSVAMADYVISLPTFSMAPTASEGFSFSIPAGGSQQVLGYKFEGSYDELNDFSSSYASDMHLLLIAPDSSSDSAGGYSTLTNTLGLWSFDGSISNNDGFYSDPGKAAVNTLGATAGGDWFLVFTNDYTGTTHTWSNVKVTIITPTPGAAALAGVAGLCAMRRRRA